MARGPLSATRPPARPGTEFGRRADENGSGGAGSLAEVFPGFSSQGALGMFRSR